MPETDISRETLARAENEIKWALSRSRGNSVDAAFVAMHLRRVADEYGIETANALVDKYELYDKLLIVKGVERDA